jgi:hypothetical protein
VPGYTNRTNLAIPSTSNGNGELPIPITASGNVRLQIVHVYVMLTLVC